MTACQPVTERYKRKGNCWCRGEERATERLTYVRLFLMLCDWLILIRHLPTVEPQVSQARNTSIGEYRHCCVTFEYKDLYGEKTYRFRNLRKWKDSIKNSLPYMKCVLRLSCVVHGPIYSRYREKTVYITSHKTAINRPRRDVTHSVIFREL